MSKQNNLEFFETMMERKAEALKHLNRIPGFEKARVINKEALKRDFTEDPIILLGNSKTPVKLHIKCRDRQALNHEDISLRVTKDRRYSEIMSSSANLIIEFVFDTDSAVSDYKGKDLLAVKIFDLDKLRNSNYTLRPSRSRIWNEEKMNVSGNSIFLDVVPCKNAQYADLMAVPKSINNYILGAYKEVKIS